ncbi:MAG: ATP-grasp domain-containing protein [bacterium]
MSEKRVLVVGTTPDYIAHIEACYPGRALFVVDRSRSRATPSPDPEARSIVHTSLAQAATVLADLEIHQKRWKQRLVGVVGYDCEQLPLAAVMAGHFGLPHPSLDSVRLCRNKLLSKMKWSQHGVRCPQAALATDRKQVLQFMRRVAGPVVLKPAHGAGSELTFRCDSLSEIARNLDLIRDGLEARRTNPLFSPDTVDSAPGSADPAVVLEEYIDGREYSCDFMMDDTSLTILRLAKKIRRADLPFGTTVGYLVPARLPSWLSISALESRLRAAAETLGLKRTLGMVDFIVRRNEVVLLELTPRVGGDCLPMVLRHSCGMDTIGLALDFAEGKTLTVPNRENWRTMVGLRLFADRPGVLTGTNTSLAEADHRTREIMIKWELGHRITLPPQDYDSWLMGHLVFEPAENQSHEQQCADLGGRISFDVELHGDQKFSQLRGANGRAVQSAPSAA